MWGATLDRVLLCRLRRHRSRLNTTQQYAVGSRQCATERADFEVAGQKEMVYCENNAYLAALKTNGGHDVFGTHSECFRKGYARGFNQKVADVPRFVQKWSGTYKAHISQKLWHRDEPVPPGYQRATLSQTMQRGFGLGSMALAKKLKQKARTESPASTKKPTLPISTRH